MRACVFGDGVVNYTGQVAFRALLPMAKVPADITKMPYAMFVGVNRVLLHYPLRHRTIMNVISIVREPSWQEEGWTIPATIKELARLHSDFHPDALVLGENAPDNQRRPNGHIMTAQGSGFFITADGYAVTNNHVVDKAKAVEITTDDGKTYDAKVVGTDPRTDLALIKVDGRSDFPYVKLAETAPQIGDWVVAVGNPFGLGGT